MSTALNARALLDGTGRLARTTSTTALTKTAATAAATIVSTALNASAMLDGMGRLVRTTSTTALTKTAAATAVVSKTATPPEIAVLVARASMATPESIARSTRPLSPGQRIPRLPPNRQMRQAVNLNGTAAQTATMTNLDSGANAATIKNSGRTVTRQRQQLQLQPPLHQTALS